ncbi:hypothetical protein KR032_011221, partial [Drosophila birchii]
IQNYIHKRQKIFNNVDSIGTPLKPKRSTRRIREFWKEVRQERLKLISAIVLSADQRLFTDISIESQTYKALLDSGATISCIGGSAAQNFLKHKNVKKCSGVIRAANGTESKVVSKLTTSIKYGDKIDDLELFIIPDLRQDIYLGIDFWQKFGLINKITSEPTVSELDIGTLDNNEESPKYHELNEGEKRRL